MCDHLAERTVTLPRPPPTTTTPDRPKPKPTTFLLWGEDDSAIGFQKRYKAPQHIPAPKLKLPGHAASYNPPDEYLLTDEEKKAWCVVAPCGLHLC